MAETDIVTRLGWLAAGAEEVGDDIDAYWLASAADEIKKLRALIIQIDKITIWDTVAGGRELQEEIDSIRRRLAGTQTG